MESQLTTENQNKKGKLIRIGPYEVDARLILRALYEKKACIPSGIKTGISMQKDNSKKMELIRNPLSDFGK